MLLMLAESNLTYFSPWALQKANLKQLVKKKEKKKSGGGIILLLPGHLWSKKVL